MIAYFCFARETIGEGFNIDNLKIYDFQVRKTSDTPSLRGKRGANSAQDEAIQKSEGLDCRTIWIAAGLNPSQ